MSDEIHILVVDDEPDVLGTLSRALMRQGYAVGTASSGDEALRFLKQQVPDLIVLDVIMPGLNGFEVCSLIRSNPTYDFVPILFLTARGHSEDVVKGLDAGGDDYVTKPFELIELQARIRALLRRAERDVLRASSTLEVGRLRLDAETCQVLDLTTGVNIQLTLTENRLLRYFMEHSNQALSPFHLLEAVWSYPQNSGDPDLVRAHIRNLRTKLGQLDAQFNFLKTIHGVGYMFNEES